MVKFLLHGFLLTEIEKLIGHFGPSKLLVD